MKIEIHNVTGIPAKSVRNAWSLIAQIKNKNQENSATAENPLELAASARVANLSRFQSKEDHVAHRRILGLTLALAACCALGACGTDRGDRAGSGAAIGAAGGAAIGAAFGGIGALPGALIGAGVGAGTGYVTDANQFNLGQPVWRR